MVKSRNNDDNEEDDGEKISNKRDNNTATVELSSVNRFYGWPASRIVRVSRATGGKDRHSKVLTSKGLRDRRVRLSVNTAIQFYDLQDRLGYDQPSKAVEWLLKAAATSIDELPPISTLFPDTPKQLSYEKRSCTQLGFDDNVNAGGAGAGEDPNVPKTSACSSNSEENNSKGSSGLSLSRSENRVKARGRAKERLAAEKEKEHESSPLNPISQATSFTDLLNSTTSTNGGYWSSTPMDYFNSGLGLSRPAQMYLAVNPPLSPLFSVSGDQHQQHHHHQHQHELQHFSFVPDQLLTSTTNNSNGSNSEYNLNFTISNNSSGLAGYNRGTLQSNSSSSLSSSSILPHLRQRFSTPIVDGSPPGFYIGTALPHVENHHQFLSYGGDGQGNNSGRLSGGNRGGKLGKN